MGLVFFYGNLNDVFGMAAAAGSIGGREKTYLAAAVAMQYISTFFYRDSGVGGNVSLSRMCM